MNTIQVSLGTRAYPIYIGHQILQKAELLNRHVVADQVCIVTNETVAKLYLPTVKAAFANQQCDHIVLPDGEQYKNLNTLNDIFNDLLTHRHRRNTTLIALGGGVICDMTGFAAACYQRGVGFIQIPTTLLAQVDASIGGKTAVNHPLGKNMIGAFHQPRCVIIDTDVLRTLPNRELYAGIAEIIKAALLRDAEFFNVLNRDWQKLLQLDNKALEEAITRACQIKAQIVAADEHETGDLRALLNLGHTFGHAIEQVLGYGKWLHGEAVAVGMVLAADLSQRLGWLTPRAVTKIKELLVSVHLPIALPPEIQYDKMFAAMKIDKKMQTSALRLVLLKVIGHAVLVDDVDLNLVEQVLRENTEKK